MNVKLIGKHEKDSRASRDAVALPLKDMMAKDESIVYVDCDLMGCINTKQLVAAYPLPSYPSGTERLRRGMRERLFHGYQSVSRSLCSSSLKNS